MNYKTEILKAFLDNKKLVTSMNNCSHHSEDHLNPYHLEGSVWTHTMMVYNNANENNPLELVMALCHDIGKVLTRKYNPKTNKVSFFGHAEASIQIAIDFIEYLFIDGILDRSYVKDIINFVLLPIANHTLFYQNPDKISELCNFDDGIMTFLERMAYLDATGSISKANKIKDNIVYNKEGKKKTNENLPKVTIWIGVPGSGKDFLAEKECKENGGVIFSFDNIREKVYNDISGLEKKELYEKAFNYCNDHKVDLMKMLKDEIFDAVKNGVTDIHICNTSLTRKSRRAIINTLGKKFTYSCKQLFVPLHLVTKRNNERDSKYVSPSVINDMMTRMTVVTHFEDNIDKIEYIYNVGGKNYMLRIDNIEATTISDAWFQTLYRCVEHGKKFKIDSGSFSGQERLEFDYATIHIKTPHLELLPKINPLLNIPDPVDENYLNDYLPYLMTGEEKEGEAYCYDKHTSVLTRNGWKLFKDLSENDEMATINPKNDEIVYQPLIKLHKMHYKGIMHNYQTEQIDCCVTPNHKMYVSVNNKNFDLIRSKDISSDNITFKTNGVWNSSYEATFFNLPSYDHRIEIRVPIDNWLKFFGKWLAVGSLKKDTRSIIIDGYSYKKDYAFEDEPLYYYLENFVDDKFIPRELLNSSSKQLTILFNAMCGSKNCTTYSTESYKLAECVQELLLKIGLSASITNDNNTYKVIINKALPTISREEVKIIDYDDYVYCAEVKDYHTLYVKRNDKPCWSGNTYGQRICAAYMDYNPKSTKNLPEFKNIMIQEDEVYNSPLIINFKNNIFWLNQMELMIWTYKNKGHRTNQMILQVGQPDDMLLKDPPCLRHIDTRVQDNKLHFFPAFRSWDLWGGFPANLAAIELMKQYCAESIGVGNGEIIASSKGLHLYDYVWDLAQLVRGKTFNEFKQKIKKEL